MFRQTPGRDRAGLRRPEVHRRIERFQPRTRRGALRMAANHRHLLKLWATPAPPRRPSHRPPASRPPGSEPRRLSLRDSLHVTEPSRRRAALPAVLLVWRKGEPRPERRPLRQVSSRPPPRRGARAPPIRPSGATITRSRFACSTRYRRGADSVARFLPRSDAQIEQQYPLSVEPFRLVRDASS
jgi:hypothetical protein